ncbi:hypothetical protein PIIN_10858 [Serendipita indica DSM 11827]|uniref:Uncharacterized protein n=1 Tax=Serendipita indica (strain DSM 11827) TaxID=1109443 RepID=G4TZY0_SERID|nr:hypothetical protein PIIN_10858 [Serendipita indica DSM 11827]
MLSNPFSPGSPSSSSPHKVGLKDKIKGEFMVVQGVLSRDEGLKEAEIIGGGGQPLDGYYNFTFGHSTI